MSKDIKLKHPITIDGTEISVLRMRRPKVKDMLATDKIKNAAERDIATFANLCEVSPADIEELDMADMHQLQEAFQDFLS